MVLEEVIKANLIRIYPLLFRIMRSYYYCIYNYADK